jgi:hypothetical protein
MLYTIVFQVFFILVYTHVVWISYTSSVHFFSSLWSIRRAQDSHESSKKERALWRTHHIWPT